MSAILAMIPWDTIALAVGGGLVYAWSEIKGSGAINKKGWKWDILIHIIDSVVQMTYQKYVKEAKVDGKKLSDPMKMRVMSSAVSEIRKRAEKYGLNHEILEKGTNETDLRNLVEARVANAKSAKKVKTND